MNTLYLGTLDPTEAHTHQGASLQGLRASTGWPRRETIQTHHMNTRICVCIYICICIHIYNYMYIYIYTCIPIRVHICIKRGLLGS